MSSCTGPPRLCSPPREWGLHFTQGLVGHGKNFFSLRWEVVTPPTVICLGKEQISRCHFTFKKWDHPIARFPSVGGPGRGETHGCSEAYSDLPCPVCLSVPLRVRQSEQETDDHSLELPRPLLLAVLQPAASFLPADATGQMFPAVQADGNTDS